MLTLFAFVLTILYTISWVGYSKYQFIERDSTVAAVKANANTIWHRYKFMNQVVFFAAVYFISGIELAISLAFLYQLAFNAAINVIVENQPVFHLGNDPIDLTMKKIFGETLAFIVLVLIVSACFATCLIFPHLLDFLNYTIAK